jgi:hypothetical protein
MQTPRPSFRTAIRRFTEGPDAAIYAVIALVLVFQASPRLAGMLQSAVASASATPADSLVLKTASYCDKMPGQKVSKVVVVREIPKVVSEVIVSSDMDNDISMEQDADAPSLVDRPMEESTGSSFLDQLPVGGFRLHRWLNAQRRLLDRLPMILRADLERRPWSDGRTSGEGLLISWMNHDILRIERQKTRLSHAVTELSFSVSLRTGDPRRPWAVFGVKAIGRSAQNELHAIRSVSQELFAHSLAPMPEAWVAEISVVAPVPAVLGGNQQESYSASWSAGSANPAAFFADECPMTEQSGSPLVV